MCSVCLEPFFGRGADGAGGGDGAKSEAVVKVACGHLFHRRCVEEWLKHDLRCPNCRFDVLQGAHT